MLASASSLRCNFGHIHSRICTKRKLFLSRSQKRNERITILERFASGEISAFEASEELETNERKTNEILLGDFATLDVDRKDRTGFPEVVWGPGKTPEQIATIMVALSGHQDVVMATRISAEVCTKVMKVLPDAIYNSMARVLTYSARESVKTNKIPGKLAILSAGTSDLAVAEEARITAEVMGCSVIQFTDIGVAGLHRLLSRLDAVREADIVVVVAGMDGALPSVVAGLVNAPVIAVPTSIGYGAAFQGVAPLLSALNSCAPGVVVVNIDNGFGAAMAAARMLKTAANISSRAQ